jgi:ABC-2 type transport system permease protein/lipopolysaccharide transport system permease protein
MLIPLIGFIFGIALLLEAVLAYRGVNFLLPNAIASQRKGNLLLAISSVLVAIACTLGIGGYFNFIDPLLLRVLRISFVALGLTLACSQIFTIWLRSISYKKFQDSIQSRWREEKRYQELLHVLVSRNLKVRYRGSFLGVYWSLLNPLIMTGLYTAIFGATFASYYGNSIVNYMLAAFTGLLVINFFSASTSQALGSVVSNGALLNKIQLPMSIFPVSMIAANVFQFIVGVLPLLAIVTLIISKSLINVLALLFPLIALTLVCTGVGFLVSGLYVFFRDLPYFYELVVFVLWISSPIFYPAAIVPTQVKPLLALNPLSPIIESIRQIVLSEGLPNAHTIAATLLSGIIIWVIGWTCFSWWRSQFMDLL